MVTCIVYNSDNGQWIELKSKEADGVGIYWLPDQIQKSDLYWFQLVLD